jgi:phosphate ABC transporter phosphate-binding protein
MRAKDSARPLSPGGDPDDMKEWLTPKERAGSPILIVILVVVAVVFAGIVGGYATGAIAFTKTRTVTVCPTCNTTAAYEGPPCGGAVLAGGSTFVFPLMSVWTSAFSLQACNSTGTNGATRTEIDYQAVGSGSGIANLESGLYIFGASDAPLTPTQTRALGVPTVTMPDSAGAVTILYNLKVTNSAGATEPINLTGAVVAAIYLGSITNWDATPITSLNPGLVIPNQTITVEHRSDGSGTSFAFSTFLSEESASWNASIGASISPAWPRGLGQKGSEGVAGAVASTVGAIGYDELNYAEQEGSNVQVARVMNPAGNYILPSVADTGYAVDNASNLPAPTGNWSGYSIINGKGAGTYPISTLTYLMIYEDIGKAPAYHGQYTKDQAEALVSFLLWLVYSGQTDSVGLFYVPLPLVLVDYDLGAIGDITYNGQTLVSYAS